MKSCFLQISLVLAAVAVASASMGQNFDEAFLNDLKATPSRCELRGKRLPDVVQAYGSSSCSAVLECRNPKGAAYRNWVYTAAFDGVACPPVHLWPDRADWAEARGHVFTENAKSDNPAESTKRIRTFEVLPNGQSCHFNGDRLSVEWIKQADGSERPYCLGSVACYERDPVAKKWVAPKTPPPMAIGCSPRTKENFRRGEVYCKESVRECFAEQKDFPIKQNVPIREDLRLDTLTGLESDAKTFVSRDRTLANPDVGGEQIHDGRTVDRKPQSDPRPVGEALVLGRVR